MRTLLLAIALHAAALPAVAATVDATAWDQGGDLAYRRALAPAAQERRLNADRSVATRLRMVANRVVAGAAAVKPNADSLSWMVNVVTDPAPDVVAFPNGRLLVNSGLATNAGLRDEEVAAALAHAVAHELLGHDRRRVEQAVGDRDAAAADPNQRALAVATAVAEQVRRPYSAAEIAAADRASAELLARAAYDPRAAAGAWRKLASANAPLASRYPVDAARLAALEEAASAAVPVYEDAVAKAAARQSAPGPLRGIR